MAQLNSGPAPSSNRRRRNATVPMVPLPAAGRSGPPPAWPLRPDMTTAAALATLKDQRLVLEGLVEDGDPPKGTHARLAQLDQKIALVQARLDAAAELEGELWLQLWATPQAVMWERLKWVRDVAQYVRWKVLAELGDLNASKEARQLSDRLGLHPLAMLRLRWEIVDKVPGPPGRPASDSGGPAPVTPIDNAPSRRSRLS